MDRGRIHLSENEEDQLLAEVEEFCPLCHKPLIEGKNGRTYKKYQLAHIYPHSPTQEQVVALKGVPIPDDVESLDNIIPLCKDCHGKQDFHTTVEDYMNLYEKKQYYSGRYQARVLAYADSLDPEIKSVVRALDNITEKELAELTYKPVAIESKIHERSLGRKIKSNVAQYFPFVQSEFSKLDETKTGRYQLIATQVKAHYFGIKQDLVQQEAIFDSMVEWFANTTGKSKAACEIVVSFFVQNCEVFDAVTK